MKKYIKIGLIIVAVIFLLGIVGIGLGMAEIMEDRLEYKFDRIEDNIERNWNPFDRMEENIERKLNPLEQKIERKLEPLNRLEDILD